jgi:hypothetical protein
MRRHTKYDDRRAPKWPEVRDRPRVLLENADLGIGEAAERVLRRHGYDVVSCGGPDHLRHHACPLLTDGRCTAVDGADVIVHSLNPDHARNAAVLRQLRSTYGEVPTVVEVPGPAVDRHRALLDGCVTLRFPATEATLLDAVHEALGEQ